MVPFTVGFHKPGKFKTTKKLRQLPSKEIKNSDNLYLLQQNLYIHTNPRNPIFYPKKKLRFHSAGNNRTPKL